MRALTGSFHRQVIRMNVPVHQIMLTSDRRTTAACSRGNPRSCLGDPYGMWFLDDARGLIGDVYGPEVLRTFDTLRPFAYRPTWPAIAL
jgi:hypothetical protein